MKEVAALNYSLYHKAFERLKKINKQKSYARISVLIVGVVIGLAIGTISAVLEEGLREDAVGIAMGSAFFVPAFLAFLLQLILHEAGHLVFGLMTGYSFSSFRVFIFTVYRREGKLRFGLRHVPGTAGQCLMLPPKHYRHERPITLYNMGGVIMNSLTALLFLALAVFLYGALPQFFFWFFAFSALFGIIFALLNGIPFKSAALSNDGANQRLLHKRPETVEAYYDQLLISNALSEGKRLRDMPDEWFSVGQSAETTDPLIATVRVLFAQRLLDSGHLEEAEKAFLTLAVSEEALYKGHFYAVMVELLYLEMMLRHRQSVADAYFAEMAAYFKATSNTFTTLRVMTVYQYLFVGNMNVITANESKLAAMRKRAPYPGDAESECELLARARAVYTAWRASQFRNPWQ